MFAITATRREMSTSSGAVTARRGPMPSTETPFTISIIRLLLPRVKVKMKRKFLPPTAGISATMMRLPVPTAKPPMPANNSGELLKKVLLILF